MTHPLPLGRVERLETRDLPSAAFQTAPIIPSDLAAVDTARSVAALGVSLGRRPDAFMLLGDSNSAEFSSYAPGFLSPLGAAGYNASATGLAAAHPELLQALATFQAALPGGLNSFYHSSVAAVAGYRASDLLQHVDAELAVTNAGLALIAIGTNDVMLQTDPGYFRSELDALVAKLESAGVVPVLSTIPDNYYQGGIYEAGVLQFNQIIADLAGERHLPLWNAWAGVTGLPNHGMDSNGGVHFNVSPNGGGAFSATDLQFGQNQRNLEALQVLAWYQAQVQSAPPYVAPSASWSSLAGHTVYAVGRGDGQAPSVSVYDAATGQELDRFLAFAPQFSGGARVAVGDVNGDGVPDVVVAAGPSGGPQVEVFSGADGSLLGNFFAFDPAFRNGISSVAAADLDGDGKAEVVVGAGIGGGPVVAVFHGGDLGLAERFFAYDAAFRGGVQVAAGTFTGMGPAIVTIAGPGGGPAVHLYAYGNMAPGASFFAGDPTDAGGSVLAAVDLAGAGSDAVFVGKAQGVPVVGEYDPLTGRNVANFYVGSPTGGGGARLAALRGAKGARGALLVGNGAGDAVSVAELVSTDGTMRPLSPTDSGRAFGVYVG